MIVFSSIRRLCLFIQSNPEEAEGSGSAEPEPEINVASLIAPLHSSPCLVRTKDWWTYQVPNQSRVDKGQLIKTMPTLGVIVDFSLTSDFMY